MASPISRSWQRGPSGRCGLIEAGGGSAPGRVVADAAPPGEVAPGQVDQGGDPVAAAKEGDRVQGKPGEPGGRAAGADRARELDNRGAEADGGHDALVAVAERDRRLPGFHPPDLAGSVLPICRAGRASCGSGWPSVTAMSPTAKIRSLPGNALIGDGA